MTWFRGQTHTHSYWSDGRGFPEQVVEAYRRGGFAFMCLSDHNRFADRPDMWVQIAAEEGSWPPKATRAMLDACIATFGADSVDQRVEDGNTLVRLKTLAELQARFNEPGRFLLMPGIEVTQCIGDRLIHMNYLNLPRLLPSLEGAKLIQRLPDTMSIGDAIRANTAETARLARELARPYVLTVNHPFSFFCDVLPQDVLDEPAIRYFEVCNNGASHQPPPEIAAFTCEMFWDAVNAFRCIRGQPLLYGMGSDDSHFYDEARLMGESGVGDAWIAVRAAELSAGCLIDAMDRGDFYASCGVELDDVRFDPSSGTLHVKVHAEPGVQYRIHFVTTRQGFDERITHITVPAQKPRPGRSIPIYSADIGRIASTIEGIEGSYRLRPDDLYVRARVESDQPIRPISKHMRPKFKTAWTQPHARV